MKNEASPLRSVAIATFWPVLVVAGIAALNPALTHWHRLYEIIQPCVEWTCVSPSDQGSVTRLTHTGTLGFFILGPISFALSVAGGVTAVPFALVATFINCGLFNLALLVPSSAGRRSILFFSALLLWLLTGFANAAMGT